MQNFIILFLVGCLIYALWDYWGTIFSILLWTTPVLIAALYTYNNSSNSTLKGTAKFVLLLLSSAAWFAASAVAAYFGIGLGAVCRELPTDFLSWLLTMFGELGEGTFVAVIVNIINNCFAAIPQFVAFMMAVAFPSFFKDCPAWTVGHRIVTAVALCIFITYSMLTQDTSPTSPYTKVDTISTMLSCIAGAVAGVLMTLENYKKGEL